MSDLNEEKMISSLYNPTPHKGVGFYIIAAIFLVSTLLQELSFDWRFLTIMKHTLQPKCRKIIV